MHFRNKAEYMDCPTPSPPSSARNLSTKAHRWLSGRGRSSTQPDREQRKASGCIVQVSFVHGTGFQAANTTNLSSARLSGRLSSSHRVLMPGTVEIQVVAVAVAGFNTIRKPKVRSSRRCDGRSPFRRSCFPRMS